MWPLRNKLNSMNAQKWYSFNYIRTVPVTSLVFIIVMMVSFTSAQMRYPPERNELVARDSNTLLSSEFLSFLNECNKPNIEIPIQLCTMYYDMVFNAYEFGSVGNDTKIAIQKADQELEKPELIKEFCEIFRNETINNLDKQPFSLANGYNVTEWIQMNPICVLNCLVNSNKKSNYFEVKQVCKFISGGFRWISEQKKKQYLTKLAAQNVNPIQSGNVNDKADEKVDTNSDDEKTQEMANANINARPVSNQIAPQIAVPNTNAKSNPSSIPTLLIDKINSKTPDDAHVSKQVDNSISAAQLPPVQSPGNVTPSLNKTSPSNVNANKKPSISNNIEQKIVPPPPMKQTQSSLLDIQSEDDGLDGNDNKLKPDFDDENPENEDETEEDNHNEQEQEVPLEISNNNNVNVNNMHNTQSRLLSNQVEFHEDKESSFFPYFMFLMFVVVTFYVAYHNKSKILALLIEGRRSRSYSSRGGGRRKQHSAEYRKLDSNLEEAIQSDGGHVLSTQIIY